MIGILAMLAGVLSTALAAGAEHESEKERRIRWLQLRLVGRTGPREEDGWRTVPDESEPVPAPTGVDIWRWSDGHRIVRLVTEEEVDAIFEASSSTMYDLSPEDFLGAVEPFTYEEAKTLAGTPQWSSPFLFAYLNAEQSPEAIIGVDGDGKLVGIGSSDDKIEGEKARSRVYRFLTDTGLGDPDELHILWHEDILIDEKLLAAMDQIEKRTLTEAQEDHLLRSVSTDVRRYLEAYKELFWQVQENTAYISQVDYLRGLEWDDEALFTWIEESGWQPSGIEADEAYEEFIQADPRPDIDDYKEGLKALLNEAVDSAEHEMHEQGLSALHAAMQAEAEVVHYALESHTHRATNGGRNRDQFEIINEGQSVYSEDSTATGYARIDNNRGYDHPRATWVIESGDYATAGDLGHIRLLEPWFETRTELYSKADAPTWQWPGSVTGTPYEAERLLGLRNFNPVQLDLLEFLAMSYTLGLTHPEHIRIWGYGLQEGEGITPRYPVVRP